MVKNSSNKPGKGTDKRKRPKLRKQLINIGTGNVQGFYQKLNGVCEENKAKMDIVVIMETKKKGQ